MAPKIVLKRHWEGNKGSTVLRSSTARRHKRVPMSNQSTTRIRTGTYGKGNAPLKGWIGLLLILNSMHNTATDRQCAKLHWKTQPAKKPTPLTTLSSSLRCESVAEHYTADQLLEDRQDKAPKESQKKRPIMEYLPGLSHDTMPLSCSTGSRANVLLKGHLSIKRYLIW